MEAETNSVRLVLLRPRTEVALAELVRIDGASCYSVLHFADGRQLKVALPIHQLMVRMPGLVRIHKRHLINLAYVSALLRHQSSLQLTTGERLPVARRRLGQVRLLYLKHRQLTL